MFTNDVVSGQREATRASLRERADCLWVSAPEWRQLLVSHRLLQRNDVRKAGVRGLFDRASGKRYFIEEELLLALN